MPDPLKLFNHKYSKQNNSNEIRPCLKLDQRNIQYAKDRTAWRTWTGGLKPRLRPGLILSTSEPFAQTFETPHWTAETGSTFTHLCCIAVLHQLHIRIRLQTAYTCIQILEQRQWSPDVRRSDQSTCWLGGSRYLRFWVTHCRKSSRNRSLSDWRTTIFFTFSICACSLPRRSSYSVAFNLNNRAFVMHHNRLPASIQESISLHNRSYSCTSTGLENNWLRLIVRFACFTQRRLMKVRSVFVHSYLIKNGLIRESELLIMMFRYCTVKETSSLVSCKWMSRAATSSTCTLDCWAILTWYIEHFNIHESRT